MPKVPYVPHEERRNMTDEELKEVYTLFSELWKLVKHHHSCKTDAEYDALRQRASEIEKQFGNGSIGLIVATLDYIERGCKK